MKQELTKQQIQFLNKCTNGTWELNSKTGLVDIDGDFDCEANYLKDFKGIRFGVVRGDFDCSINNLKSLVGAPQKVGGYFDCSSSNLTSLVGAPQKVGGDFYCCNNSLTSLVGAPQEVGGYFDCSSSNLTSLVGAPQKVGGYFSCSNNNLKSLEGAPQKVGGDFSCFDNSIPEKILLMIWDRMKNGVSYYIALASLKKKLEELKEKEIQKIISKYDSLLSQIKDENLAKGASALNKIGLF